VIWATTGDYPYAAESDKCRTTQPELKQKPKGAKTAPLRRGVPNPPTLKNPSKQIFNINKTGLLKNVVFH